MSFDINGFSRRVYKSATEMKRLSPEKQAEMTEKLRKELKGASGNVAISPDAKANIQQALDIFEKCLHEDASAIVAALEPSRIVGEFTRDLTNFLKRGERVEKSEKSGES